MAEKNFLETPSPPPPFPPLSKGLDPALKKYPAFTCNLTTAPSRGSLLRHHWMVAKRVNRKMTGELLVLAVNPLYSHWLLLLQTFSAVAFYCHFYWCNKAPSKTVCCSFKEFDVTRIRPRLRGLPGLAGRAARLGLGWWVTPAIMSLLCKRD